MGGIIERAWQGYRDWTARRRRLRQERESLAGMDERLLRDIGLRPEDVPVVLAGGLPERPGSPGRCPGPARGVTPLDPQQLRAE